MATLKPSLTLSSTDAFINQPISLSVTDSLTISAPMSDISTMNTDDNIGNGAGVIIGEDTNQYYVYVKHTGKLTNGGPCHTSNDFITFTDSDGTAGALTPKLQPGEFMFFPIKEGDGSAGSGGDGGLKVVAASAVVRIEYGYWKRA